MATDAGANAPASGDGDIDTDDGSTSGDDDIIVTTIENFLDNSGLNIYSLTSSAPYGP